MTNSNTTLAAIIAFVVGALVALGGEHLIFAHKDQRDTMATIGAYKDWRLNCPPRTDKKGSCVIQSAIVQKNSSNVIAELNVGVRGKSDMLTVVAPLGIVVLPGVKLDIPNAPEKVLPFKTCIQMGCVANLVLDQSFEKSLSSNDGGTITVMTVDGKSVPLSFSLHGFADAMAARAIDMAARK